MNINEFITTIASGQIPVGLPSHLQALWYDQRGDWTKAHDLIDELNGGPAAHVHAYLHRKEGDIWNADYWYTIAGKKRPEATLKEEWKSLVTLYLKELPGFVV